MVTRPHYAYDLSGGRLCLDFTNTISNRGSDAPVDHLQSYDDLVAFAEQSGAVRPAAARELVHLASSHPAAARHEWTAALALRESLYRLFAALAGGDAPRPADIAALNDRVPSAF